MTQVKMNMDGFKVIERSLKDNYKTRVGILGSDAQKAQGDMTMADIGAVHEFGSHSRNIPKRSFLRMPLEEKIWEWVKKNSSYYYEMMKENSLKKWYKSLGLAAEDVINQAFNTQGFGKWEALSQKVIAGKEKKIIDNYKSKKVQLKRLTEMRKSNHSPLIDTGALMRSISSKVINNDK